jgi:hypothetical protein
MITAVDLYNASRPAKLDVSVSNVPQQQPTQQRSAPRPAEPAIATWNRLIAETLQADRSLTRPQAVGIVARQHPALRERLLAEANPQLKD